MKEPPTLPSVSINYSLDLEMRWEPKRRHRGDFGDNDVQFPEMVFGLHQV